MSFLDLLIGLFIILLTLRLGVFRPLPLCVLKKLDDTNDSGTCFMPDSLMVCPSATSLATCRPVLRNRKCRQMFRGVFACDRAPHFPEPFTAIDPGQLKPNNG